MVLITFKDGVSVKLHEDDSIEFITGSNVDVEYNYHMIMATSEAEFVDNEKHIDILYNNINKRLDGVLTP